MLKQVIIFSDGSSLGNGRENPVAAAAALLCYRGKWKAVGCFLGPATNQQAEIAAAAVGLESLNESCRVLLYTDSRYVVETMCGRFKKKTNLDWWNKLEHAARIHQITWRWIKGHAGEEPQEICDHTARTIAENGRVDQKILDEATSRLVSLSATAVKKHLVLPHE
ncbi:MAG: ribonuclease HI [Pyrinomonadaceae bacterium]